MYLLLDLLELDKSRLPQVNGEPCRTFSKKMSAMRRAWRPLPLEKG